MKRFHGVKLAIELTELVPRFGDIRKKPGFSADVYDHGYSLNNIRESYCADTLEELAQSIVDGNFQLYPEEEIRTISNPRLSYLYGDYLEAPVDVRGIFVFEHAYYEAAIRRWGDNLDYSEELIQLPEFSNPRVKLS